MAGLLMLWLNLTCLLSIWVSPYKEEHQLSSSALTKTTVTTAGVSVILGMKLILSVYKSCSVLVYTGFMCITCFEELRKLCGVLYGLRFVPSGFAENALFIYSVEICLLWLPWARGMYI